MIDKNLVAIILVNWNGSEDTVNCLETIFQSSYSNYIVIVVDNGSSDEQIILIREYKYKIIIIETGENLGYTGGNNIGIKRALELGANYIFLLNNDTFIAKDTIEKLIISLENDETIGIISPKILFHPQRKLIWSAGTVLNKRNLMGFLIGYKLEDEGQFNKKIELDYVTGCAMMIKHQVIAKVGLLCNDYFAVCEDLDYCLKVKNADFKIMYEPTATVWHIESASSGSTNAPQYVYYQIRNYFLFHNRNSKNLKQLIQSNLYFSISIIIRGIGFISDGKWRALIAIILGVRDVLINKLGRQDYNILKIKN